MYLILILIVILICLQSVYAESMDDVLRAR